MLEIDEVINALKNGEWHHLDDIIKKSKVPEPKVKAIVKFLAEYRFIEINDNQQKVKIIASLQKFLKETQR